MLLIYDFTSNDNGSMVDQSALVGALHIQTDPQRASGLGMVC